MKKPTFLKDFRLIFTNKSNNFLFLLCSFLLVLGQSVTAQMLIDPNAEGGFENGATFADNGWTTVNDATSKWQVGTAPGWFSGSGGAYVSNNDGTSWAYTNNTISRSSFYRDVTFPTGATTVTLNFDWRGNGNDGNWDNLVVYVMDTSITPTNAGPVGTGTTVTGWPGYTNGTTGYFLLQKNGTTAPTTTTAMTYSFTAAQLAYVSGQTKRLVFMWKNDGSGGTNPPASIDNISLEAIVPTCFAPTALTNGPTTTTSSMINWSEPATLPSVGYEFEVRNSGAAGSGATGLFSSGTLAVGSVSENLTGLIENTNYTFYIRSSCGAGDFSTWASVSFLTGYCVPSSTLATTYINNFSTTGGSTNISNLASGYTPTGYKDNFDSGAVSQYATASFTFTTAIVGGTAGTAVWVDWNKDLIFELSERVFVTTSYGDGQTGTVLIPAGTALGDYRLRIKLDYNAITPDACASTNTRSETEDYKLTVIAPPTCLPASGLTATANTAFTATLNWTASVSSPANGYDYYVTDSATLPNLLTTPTGNVGAGIVTALVPDLISTTNYFAYVRANCGSGDTSIWTSAATFTTLCDPPTISGTTPAAICGEGTANLSATSSTGTIKWYAAATGGTAIATGESFTTPSINTTTSYWAEASVGGGVQTSGKLAPPTTATGSTLTNWGIVFNATASVSLQSVSLYSTSAGTVDIKITNAELTEIYSTGNVAVAAGGTTTPTIIPLNFTVPVGTGYRILVKSYTGVNLIRDSTALAFPYSGSDGVITVTSSEWGGTTTGTYYYFYDLQYGSLCASPRTEVVATVSTSPALILSTTDTDVVCSGQSTAAVTLTSNATDFDTYVWSPDTDVTGDAATGWIFSPAITTTYTLTASQSTGSLCQTTTTLTVNVNPNPVIYTSVSNATICEGSSSVLTATTDSFAPGTVNVGTDTTLTSNIAQPTAFCNRWKQYWNQTIFTAAELQAAGLGAGNITSIAYNITTLGDGTNVNGFEISIGSTTNSTATAFVTTGLTQVYGPATYAHTIGMNTIVFDTPYTWDGVSNIVLDVRQLGADSIYNAITYYTATTSNMTISATSSTAPATNTIQTLVANANVTPALSLQRLNVVFGGQTGSIGVGTLNYTWNPGSLTGNIVTVSPVETTTYTVRGTNATTGCFTEATVVVTVNLAPAPTGDAVQIFNVISGSDVTVNDLVASGNDVVWYASEVDALAGTNPLALTTELVDGGVYYAMQTTTEGCTSVAPLAVTVTVALGTSSFDLKGLKYYPNPVTNVLNVTYTGTITGVEVFNMLGQKIASKNVNEISTTIDMSNLASGSYFVKVNAANGSRTIKVMKK